MTHLSAKKSTIQTGQQLLLHKHTHIYIYINAHTRTSQRQEEYDPNWAAAWDATNQAYYYYHTISGETRWDTPFGFDTSSLVNPQDQLPDELQRELAQQVL